jgi:hypothetical protein
MLGGSRSGALNRKLISANPIALRKTHGLGFSAMIPTLICLRLANGD